jgi:hypothetical protein
LTAAAARESRRRFRTAERAANHSLSIRRRTSVLLSVSSANAARKRTVQASIWRAFRRWRPGASAAGSKVQQPPPLPIERKRPAQWQAFAIIVAPGTDSERGAE